MNLVVLREAAAEFEDAAAYYDQQESGLGHRYRDEVDRHIQWILQNALVPRIRKGGYRRVNLTVFPYYVAYVIKDNCIYILAIAHGHRKPEYWIGR